MRGLIPGPQPGGGGGNSGPGTVIIRGVTGTPAAGSTNNRIPQFNAQVFNNGGADFTFTNSATLGGYFTIVTPGLYFVQGAFPFNTTGRAGVYRGPALNNTLTLTETDTQRYPLGIDGVSAYFNLSGYVQCAANDLLHMLGDGAVFAGFPGLWKFQLVGPF